MLSTGEKNMILLTTAPAAILISLFGCATAIPEVKQLRTHPSTPLLHTVCIGTPLG